MVTFVHAIFALVIVVLSQELMGNSAQDGQIPLSRIVTHHPMDGHPLWLIKLITRLK